MASTPESEARKGRSRESSRFLAPARENLRKARAALEAVNYQTPRRQAASRANIRKAQVTNLSRSWLTPRRLAAVRANVRRAWAANRGHYRRTPRRLEAIRHNAVKHGFYSVSLEDTLARLQEDPKEFEGHVRLIARVFSPQDETEQRIVRQLAEAVWLHLRLFRALARWQADALRHYLSLAPEITPLSPDLTLARGYSLRAILLDQGQFHRLGLKILGRVERLISTLLRKRTGGKLRFDSNARRISRSMRESEKKEAWERMWDRVSEGGPEAERIFREVESQSRAANSQ